jgi:hypothetical protein
VLMSNTSEQGLYLTHEYTIQQTLRHSSFDQSIHPSETPEELLEGGSELLVCWNFNIFATYSKFGGGGVSITQPTELHLHSNDT